LHGYAEKVRAFDHPENASGTGVLRRTNRAINRFAAWQYWALACKRRSEDNCNEEFAWRALYDTRSRLGRNPFAGDK
jgi:hypothetical protein